MGMSDKQFDAYKKRLMRELEHILEKLNSDKEKAEKELKLLVDDLKSELEKP